MNIAAHGVEDLYPKNRRSTDRARIERKWKSPHFDIENDLFHIRVDDRRIWDMDPYPAQLPPPHDGVSDGDTVLFVEEFQSDANTSESTVPHVTDKEYYENNICVKYAKSSLFFPVSFGRTVSNCTYLVIIFQKRR